MAQRLKLSRDEKLRLCTDVGFCAHISNFAPLEKHIEVWQYQHDECIIEGNQPNEYLFYLYQGRAMVKPLNEYYSATCIVFEPTTFIGQITLFTNESTSRILTLEESFCVKIALNDDSKGILFNDAVFLYGMCEKLAEKVVKNTKRAIELSNNDYYRKIAQYMLDVSPMVKSNGESTEYGAVAVNKKQFAKDCSGTERHIQNIFSKLVEFNIIAVVEDAVSSKRGNEITAYKIQKSDKLHEIIKKGWGAHT